jgi:hypothetical protein
MLTIDTCNYQTLFSSGILRWDEDGTLGSDWVVRGGGVRLFLSICLPLTILTLSIWGIMYMVARRWAKRHGREPGLPMYAAHATQRVVAGSPPLAVVSEKEKAGAGLGVMV